MVDWKPEGTHSVTPHLVVKGAAEAIDFYVRALGAVEHARMPMGGLIGHAQLGLGDSLIYLADEWPGGTSSSPTTLKGTSAVVHVYTEDVDAAFQRAVSAGATVLMPPSDMFWGDRYAQVRCPFGHVWSFATHKEDLTLEEMGRRGEEFMKSMPACDPPPAAAEAAKAPSRKPAAKRTKPPAKAVRKPAAKRVKPAPKAARKPAAKKTKPVAKAARKPAPKAKARPARKAARGRR